MKDCGKSFSWSAKSYCLQVLRDYFSPSSYIIHSSQHLASTKEISCQITLCYRNTNAGFPDNLSLLRPNQSFQKNHLYLWLLLQLQYIQIHYHINNLYGFHYMTIYRYFHQIIQKHCLPSRTDLHNVYCCAQYVLASNTSQIMSPWQQQQKFKRL